MSLRTAVIAIFSSPSFLYLEEPHEDTSDDLTDHALANRLSYFPEPDCGRPVTG